MRIRIARVVLLVVRFGGATRAIPQDRRDDPDLAHAHHVVGLALLGARQIEAALAEGQRAEEASPAACCGPSLLARAWWDREAWTPRVEGALQRAQYAEHHPTESCCPWLDTRPLRELLWSYFAKSWLRGVSPAELEESLREWEDRTARDELAEAIRFERMGHLPRALEGVRSAQLRARREVAVEVDAARLRIEARCRVAADDLVHVAAITSDDDDGVERADILRRALHSWPEHSVARARLKELAKLRDVQTPATIKTIGLDESGSLRLAFANADEQMVRARGRLTISWGTLSDYPSPAWLETSKDIKPTSYVTRDVVVGGVNYGRDSSLLIAPPVAAKDLRWVEVRFESPTGAILTTRVRLR